MMFVRWRSTWWLRGWNATDLLRKCAMMCRLEIDVSISGCTAHVPTADGMFRAWFRLISVFWMRHICADLSACKTHAEKYQQSQHGRLTVDCNQWHDFCKTEIVSASVDAFARIFNFASDVQYARLPRMRRIQRRNLTRSRTTNDVNWQHIWSHKMHAHWICTIRSRTE